MKKIKMSIISCMVVIAMIVTFTGTSVMAGTLYENGEILLDDYYFDTSLAEEEIHLDNDDSIETVITENQYPFDMSKQADTTDDLEEEIAEEDIQTYLMYDEVQSAEVYAWSSTDSTKHKDAIKVRKGETIYCKCTLAPATALSLSIKWFVNGTERTSWKNFSEVSATIGGAGEISIYAQVTSMNGSVITSNTIKVSSVAGSDDQGTKVKSATVYLWSLSDPTSHKDTITVSMGDTLGCNVSLTPTDGQYSSIKWFVNEKEKTSWNDKMSVKATINAIGVISIYAQIICKDGSIINSNIVKAIAVSGQEGVEVESAKLYIWSSFDSQTHTDSITVRPSDTIYYRCTYNPSNASFKNIKWYLNGSERVSFQNKNEGSAKVGAVGDVSIYAQIERNDGKIIKSNSVVIHSKTGKGDLTGDGNVAMGDVLMAAKAVAGKVTLTETQKDMADVTGDREVAMGDVLKIARYVAGAVKEL